MVVERALMFGLSIPALGAVVPLLYFDEPVVEYQGLMMPAVKLVAIALIPRYFFASDVPFS